MNNKRIRLFKHVCGYICILIVWSNVYFLFSQFCDNNVENILWTIAIDMLISSVFLWCYRGSIYISKNEKILVTVFRFITLISGLVLFVIDVILYIESVEIAVLLIESSFCFMATLIIVSLRSKKETINDDYKREIVIGKKVLVKRKNSLPIRVIGKGTA